MTYCGQQTLVKYGPQERIGVTLRCRSWSCPDCQDMRRRQLMAEANSGNPNTFLTLTVKHGQHDTAAAAAAALAHAWRLLRLRTMRRHKIKSLEFIAVFEAHKSGWPHLHILARMPFVPQAWISEQMQELLNSPIVWIERLTARSKIAAYVAKYLGKNPHRFATCKRYWRSKRYSQRQKPAYLEGRQSRAGFEVQPGTLRRLAAAWATFGWRVTWLSTLKARAELPP